MSLLGEGERGRPFTWPFLFGSCSNSHKSPNEHWSFVVQRVQSRMSKSFWAVSWPFSFVFLCSELPMQVCPDFDFSL